MPGHLVHGVRAPTYNDSYPGGTHKPDQESIAHTITKAPNKYQTAVLVCLERQCLDRFSTACPVDVQIVVFFCHVDVVDVGSLYEGILMGLLVFL
jgi:hypothetical protein